MSRFGCSDTGPGRAGRRCCQDLRPPPVAQTGLRSLSGPGPLQAAVAGADGTGRCGLTSAEDRERTGEPGGLSLSVPTGERFAPPWLNRVGARLLPRLRAPGAAAARAGGLAEEDPWLPTPGHQDLTGEAVSPTKGDLPRDPLLSHVLVTAGEQPGAGMSGSQERGSP